MKLVDSMRRGLLTSRERLATFAVKTALRGGVLVAILMLAGGCAKHDSEPVVKHDPKASEKHDSTATVKRILKDNNPGLSEDNIVFDGCELTISGSAPDAFGRYVGLSGSYKKQILRADLSLFDLTHIRIGRANRNGVVLTFARVPMNDRLVDQAVRITEVLPDDFSSSEGKLTMHSGQTTVTENRMVLKAGERIGRERVEQILKNPNANLVFRLTSVAIGREPMKPHEDAPKFYDFAKRVEALPSPQMATISMTFGGTGEPRENLLSAVVMIPRFLQFKVGSLGQGGELAGALSAYRSKACHFK